MRVRISHWVAAGAVLTATIGVGLMLAAGAAGSGKVFHTCDYTGPQWKFSGGQKGTTWVLTFQNTTCGFGTPYARKLATRAAPKQYGAALSGGPAGWRCQALVAPPSKVVSGSCIKGTKYFSWHAAI